MKQFWLYILEVVVALIVGWKLGSVIGLNRIKSQFMEPISGYKIINNQSPSVQTPNNNQDPITNNQTVVSPTARPTMKPTARPVVKVVGDTAPWGVAKQIDEHTWTMKVGQDARMATPQEILVALNSYRQRRGSQVLSWDDKLTSFAQDRANYLASIKSTDGHKGFFDYTENQDGFNKLGFDWLGENISYGYQLEAVHLIEWMYAGDKPHDDNQINNRWNYVGIGVKATATALIFGAGRH